MKVVGDELPAELSFDLRKLSMEMSGYSKIERLSLYMHKYVLLSAVVVRKLHETSCSLALRNGSDEATQNGTGLRSWLP